MTSAQRGYETPEEAARGDIPARFSRVLGTATNGDLALVLLATNEPPYVELYSVRCRRRDGLWFDEGGSSGTGFTWDSSANGDELGVLMSSWEAPRGADRLRLRLQGAEHEVPAQDGYALFVARGVPDDELPEVVAWRIKGEWMTSENGSDQLPSLVRHWLMNTLFAAVVTLPLVLADGEWLVTVIVAPVLGAVLVPFTRMWARRFAASPRS